MVKNDSDLIYTRLFWFSAIVMVSLMAFVSQDFGITWDEWVHAHFGKLIVRYFMTWGADKTCMTSGGDIGGDLTLNLYGHLFDTLATIIFGIRIGSIKNAAFQDLHWQYFYETRHLLNSIVGFTGMLFTGLLAKEIAGKRAGLIALFLIFLSPVFFGHSMNNPKDIPFAMTYIMGVFYLIKFLKEFPNPTKKTIGLLALSIALSINVEFGGILLIAYVILFSGLFYLARGLAKKYRLVN